jgi:hypothetical protein
MPTVGLKWGQFNARLMGFQNANDLFVLEP